MEQCDVRARPSRKSLGIHNVLASRSVSTYISSTCKEGIWADGGETTYRYGPSYILVYLFAVDRPLTGTFAPVSLLTSWGMGALTYKQQERATWGLFLYSELTPALLWSVRNGEMAVHSGHGETSNFQPDSRLPISGLPGVVYLSDTCCQWP